MSFFVSWLVCIVGLASCVIAQTANITIVPAATNFDIDNTDFIYGASPLLIANDGSAADGGFRVFAVTKTLPFNQTVHQTTGRSKVAVPVYGLQHGALTINIPAPDSLIRVFDAKSGEKVASNDKKQLGDWSTACVWRSARSGENYLFLFGKMMVVQFLVREKTGSVEILEIQTFSVPITGESCTIFSDGRVFFAGKSFALYSFQAAESVEAPEVRPMDKNITAAGLSVYFSSSGDYLFAAYDEVIDVFDHKINRKGSINLSGISKLSIEGGLSILQSTTESYPSGAIAFAFEGADVSGVAIGSLQAALFTLGIQVNTKYNPKDKPCTRCGSVISKQCSQNGFGTGYGGCSCFAGFTGATCSRVTCVNNCSGHGQCIGPNVCQCKSGWTGSDCSFTAVTAKYETEANGGDGDDPAIWIHPTHPDQSKIITTTKSAAGQGFGVFDLQGKLLQHLTATEPNNVDIMYNFTTGNRTIDLAYAACRGDNTLCLAEINSTGLLKPISGGTQSLPKSYKPYGSCVYRSSKSNKQYLLVNNKEAKYLQYELTSTTNGTLQTTLVRSFQGGSGGQVEGCVADEAAGFLFIGEEPAGIWRYEAEPDGSSTGVQIAAVGDASGLHADVEGITLVPAKTGPGGYIIVSSQGISAYFVYERAPPHAYVMTFTIVDSKEWGINHVSNTDGITAVGNVLNENFPGGLFVTHDDANELIEGGTAAEASFKLVSLVDILAKQRIKELGY